MLIVIDIKKHSLFRRMFFYYPQKSPLSPVYPQSYPQNSYFVDNFGDKLGKI